MGTKIYLLTFETACLLTLLLNMKTDQCSDRIYREFRPSSFFLLRPSTHPYNNNIHPRPSETILVATPFPAISLPVSRRKRIFYLRKIKEKKHTAFLFFLMSMGE